MFGNRIDKSEYEKELKKLEAIEMATGVDMGFQKGVLAANADKFIMIRREEDPEYSPYDAGLNYAAVKSLKAAQEFQEMLKNTKTEGNDYNQSTEFRSR